MMNSFPFGSGRPDPASFPNRGLADAAMRILPEMGPEMAQYPGSQGYEPMRKFMSERFERREGAGLPIDQISLTTGSMQAVTLMAQYYVEKPGDAVIMEEFSYSGTIGAYAKEGAELVGVPLDDDGMRMDALEEAIATSTAKGKKPKFIYTLVTYQNPTGSIMPLSRRKELLDIAHKHDVPVVEDHCYADTVYEDCHEPALVTLDHEATVLHIESLSKILGPGVREGWFYAPEPIFNEMMALRRDGGHSTLSAAICYEFFREGLASHLQMINKVVKEKRDLMFEQLAAHPDAFEWFSRPKGGLFIWVKIPDSTDAVAFEQAADAQGIDYAQGKGFHVHHDEVPFIRLAFGYANLDQIREGIPRLAECIFANQK